MATKKFSEFDLVPTPVLADIVVVGLDDAGQNAQFPGDVFGGAAWGEITGTLADQTDLDSALNGKEAALGNPSTNGYVLSSTTGGTRSWVAQTGGGGGTWGSITGTLSAQTDLQSALDAKVTSVAGESGVVTEDELRAAIHIIDPFDYKADGEAIAILAIGDSNMVGIGGTDGTLTLNSSVYVRSTPGTSAWDAADLAWFNNSTVDPAAVTFPNLPDPDPAGPTPGISFTGVLRNNNGCTGYAIATRLQQVTGRTVYLFQTAQGGKTMAYWLPGGGAGKEGMNALVAQLPDAFAEMVNGPDFFDVVIMSDSTNDAGSGVTADTFLTNFTTVRDEFASQGWIDTKYTRWLQLEAPQEYPAYAAGWLGLQYVSNAYGERVDIISSVGIPVAVDDTHFTGIGCQTLGFNAADCVLAGVTAKALVRPDSYVEAVGGLKQDLNCNLYDLTQVDTIHASTVADTPLTFRVNNTTSYDMIYSANASLQITALTTGGNRGAWFSSRMGAGTGYTAFRFIAANTLSGSDVLFSIGDAADNDRVVVSRTGALTTDGAVSQTSVFTSDFGGYFAILTSLSVANDTVLSTGNVDSSVVAANNAVGFTFDVLNDLSAFSNTFLVDLKRGGTSRCKVDATGSLQMLNGGVLSGTLSGTGAIATSGAIGTSSTMTAGGLTCAAGTVSAQHLIGTASLTLSTLAGTGTRAMAVNSSGVPVAVGWDWTTATGTDQTTNATTKAIYNGSPADGARELWEVTVTGNRQTTAGTICSVHVFTVTRVGATCTVAATSELIKSTTGTGSTCVVDPAAFGTGWFLNVTGNASETWDWKFQYRYRSIA